MDDKAVFIKAGQMFGQNVRQVKPEQWSKEVPATPEWTVRDLVNHLAGEHLWVPELLAGKTIAEVGDKLDGELLGDEPIATWEKVEREVADSLRDADLEMLVHLSYGDTPARTYLHHMGLDAVIHSWDLARAIGADDKLDPELVELAYQWLLPEAESWRSAGALGPAPVVPEEADTQTKLIALSGRQP